MSVLFKSLLNVIIVIVIIQQVINATSDQQFTTPGTYAMIIPTDAIGVTMSMWGAGGSGTGAGKQNPFANSIMYPGGSGAFVSCTINAPPGSTIYLLVGGGGAVGDYGRSSTSGAIGGGGNLMF